ncbi:MAG: hypothetical protein IPQ07_29640 [Myxococcales bacterium]|nr:hypothetical protein [Myxococcales bacterium]
MALAVLGAPAAKLAATTLTADAAVVQGAGVFALARAGALPAKAKRGLTALVTAGGVDALCWHHGKLSPRAARGAARRPATATSRYCSRCSTPTSVHLVAPRVVELMFSGSIGRGCPDRFAARDPRPVDRVPRPVRRARTDVEGSRPPGDGDGGARGARPAADPEPDGHRADRRRCEASVRGAPARRVRQAGEPRRARGGAREGRTAEKVVAFCRGELASSCRATGPRRSPRSSTRAATDRPGASRARPLPGGAAVNGDSITTEAIAAPALLVLAKRDPKAAGRAS